MHRKIHIETPSFTDLHAAIEPNSADRRYGLRMRLELLQMDERFCAAMRREHPEMEQHGEPADLEQRKRA
jgi:hypothetical protein